MKKRQNPILIMINRILVALLGILGFASCEKEIAPMYGTPHATFTIKGKIQNETQKSIPNIQINCSGEYNGDGRNFWIENQIEAVKTDEQGNFNLKLTMMPTSKLRIFASDTDGEANGSYANDSIDVTIAKEDYKNPGKNGWNRGEVEKDNIQIQLKEIKHE